jgi:peptidoglycan biosynthesis protein MviN/MurJ (putative lipid II flippase)
MKINRRRSRKPENNAKSIGAAAAKIMKTSAAVKAAAIVIWLSAWRKQQWRKAAAGVIISRMWLGGYVTVAKVAMAIYLLKINKAHEKRNRKYIGKA